MADLEPNPQPNESAPVEENPAASSVGPIAPAPVQQSPESAKQITGSPAFGKEDTESPGAYPFGYVPGVAPIPEDKAAQQQQFESGEEYKQGARPSRWQAFSDSLSSGLSHALGGAENPLTQLLWERRINQENAPQMSPEAANAQFPERDEPYTTPVDPRVVEMEQRQHEKDQALSEWVSKGSGYAGEGLTAGVGGFIGGLTDPVSLAIGLVTGGLSEAVLPEGLGLLGKAAAHYLSNWTGFTAQENFNNLIEHQMGARRESLIESAENTAKPALYMSGISMGLSAAMRTFLDRSAGPASDAELVKRATRDIENNRTPSLPSEVLDRLGARKAGSVVDPDGNLHPPEMPPVMPTEKVLYAGEHSVNGVPSPAVFEHGLGEGHQLTNVKEMAHNAVADAASPGRISEAKIGESTKLLDLDKSAAEDYGGKDSFLKAIEAKTGISLSTETNDGQSIKDVLTKLGDWVGADIGGEKIPENITNEIQAVAKAQGYDGYRFDHASASITHIFDPAKIEPTGIPQNADPSKAGPLPGANDALPTTPAEKTAARDSYSPKLAQMVHEMRSKAEYEQAWGDKALADVNDLKQDLQARATELSKNAPELSETLQDIRKAEVQDTRLLDIAKRIADCNEGGGA